MQLSAALNLRELQRYLGRIGDRWPLQMVVVGGARIADLRRDPADATPAEPGLADGTATGPGEFAAGPAGRGPEFVVVLVSDGFDGVPWLERVHQAGALWDRLEMGDGADVHCYTAAEYLRRRETTPAVRAAAEQGLLLYADSEPFTAASSRR